MNKKNPSKNGFYFYKLEFEKNNKGKIFNKGITDIAVAALDSWTVNKKLFFNFLLSFSQYLCFTLENDATTT